MSHSKLLEVGRVAVEDTLIDLRDSGIALLGRGNGLVIRDYDSTDSHTIRMGPEHCLRIGMLAMMDWLENNPSPVRQSNWARLKESL